MPQPPEFDEAKLQVALRKNQETHSPFLDWLVGVGILVAIIAVLFFVFGNPDTMKMVADRVFTMSGLIGLGIVLAVFGTIQSIRHQIKMKKIRDEIKASMLDQWGRKD